MREVWLNGAKNVFIKKALLRKKIPSCHVAQGDVRSHRITAGPLPGVVYQPTCTYPYPPYP